MNWFEKNTPMAPDELIARQTGSEVCDTIAGGLLAVALGCERQPPRVHQLRGSQFI